MKTTYTYDDAIRSAKSDAARIDWSCTETIERSDFGYWFAGDPQPPGKRIHYKTMADAMRAASRAGYTHTANSGNVRIIPRALRVRA